MWNCITFNGVLMTSKKVLERKVTGQGFVIEDLKRVVAEKETCIRDQATMIGDLRIQASMKQTIFLTANVDAYPTKEAKDEIMAHIQERMDAELERTKMNAQAVVLPDIVKTIMVHDMKGG